MSIEKLNKVQFVVNKSDLEAFRGQLFLRGAVHLRNISTKLKPLQAQAHEEQEVRSRLGKVAFLLDVSERMNPKKTPFIANFIPNRPVIESALIAQADEDNYLEKRYLQVHHADENISSAREKSHEISEKKHDLMPFQNYLFRFENFKSMRFFSLWFIESKKRNKEDLGRLYPSLFEHALVEDFPSDEKGGSSYFVLIAPKANHDNIANLIKRSDLYVLNVHDFEGTAAENIQMLDNEKALLENQIDLEQSKLSDLEKDEARLYCIKDILEAHLQQLNGNKSFTCSERVIVVEAYVPEKDLDMIMKWVATAFPSVYFASYPADTSAPIKLSNRPFFAPFEFLLRMFGLPRYGMIDPTPAVAVLFLVLFGIAFGDVVYGLTLFMICWLIARKYRHDEGTVKFMSMFKYAGLSSAFFGMLTSSWAGDLVSSYLPESNVIHRLHLTLGVINTSEHVMVLMVAIIYLGVLAQMLAVTLAMMQNLKEAKWIQAIFDQFSWLLFMPSITLVIGQFLVPGYFPEHLISLAGRIVYLALAMIFIGGFIKTKNPVAGVFNGILNFYGIMSTYGVSALMADVLSYLRLLALAVATSSMAMSFNLVSFLFKDIPILGPILVVAVLLFSNLLNLLLSVLGAFVHPVRLLFYEVFSRFYQDGGSEFKSYGIHFRHVLVKQREA
jgi:V/A-type H+/Na+-transporting ATPase subunit I